MTADKRLIIVRHSSLTHRIVQYLRKGGFGLFLILLFVGVFSYTRAGVYTRTYTREANAATSSTLNFQGRLFGSSGAIVSDGSYSIDFNLYNVSVGGSTQWTETQSVTVRNGYFSVQLGSVTPFPGTISWDQEQWLTMNVNGDGEMTPRLKLTAVPYAFRAGQADSLTNGSGTITADNLLQKAPVSIQSFSSANSGLRLNQTGAGGLIQLQGDGSDVFTVAKTGNIVTAGTLDINGASLDIGSASQSGVLILNDGSGNTGQLQLAALASNRTYTFSDNDGVILLDSTGFAQNGNSFGTNAVLGTNDTNNLLFETNDVTRMTLDTSGNLKIGSGSAAEKLDIDGALKLGTTTNSNAGTIRWTGTDFEGFDGLSWVSFTDDYTGTPTANINKTANETENNVTNPTATLQADNELKFPMEANETWTFRFVVQANSPATADIKFSVNAPAGATCAAGVDNSEDTVTVSNLGCGVSTGILNTDGAANLYEITGTVVNGANAGDVTLYWAQNSAVAANTIVYAGSYVTAQRVDGAVSGLEFMQGGNSYGALAQLGTNDNYGLEIRTNGTSRIDIASTGEVTVNNGLIIAAGDLDLSGTESILNIGSNLTGSGALTLASGGGGDLTLDSASGILVFSDATWRRVAAGTTALELNDSADTTLNIINTDGGAVANLSVEGLISAASFSGIGSGLTALDADNISSGTLDDARLSTNVTLLDNNQTVSGIKTFSNGLILGNSSGTTAGTLRWSGTDFEGYDGGQWVSFTTGGGGGSASPAIVSVTKPSNETVNNSNTLQNDDDLQFSIGANEAWTFRFVIQATSSSVADLKFAVTAPSGATCSTGFVDEQGSISQSGVGCGVASATLSGTGANEVYEIIGTVTNGATPGTVRLQWSQDTQEASNTTVLAGSFVQAAIDGGGLQFLQGGNAFGQAATLGTTDAYGLSLITNNTAALTITSSQEASFSGLVNLNGGTVVGNAAGDSLTINSSSVSLPNGLNFDSNTLVIDATNNRIGIGDAAPANKLSINDAATDDSLAQAMIYTGGATNKGLVIQRFAAQTTNLFELQDENGNTLTFFNEDGELGLGRSTALNGALVFSNATNSNTMRLVTGTATGSRTITLPDEDGTLCIQDSTNCGFLKFAESSAQVDSTNDTSLFVNKTGASGNILTLQKNGSNVFTIANGGAVEITTTSSVAFKVQSSGGTDVFNIDTSGNIIQIGESDSTGVLFVLDTKTTAGDPSGVNGAQYYNSDSATMRCYEGGAWKDCNYQKVTKSSDQTGIGTAYTDIAGLTFAVKANTNYKIECSIIVNSSAAANGIYLGVNGPTAPTGIDATYYAPTSATAMSMYSHNGYDSITSVPATSAGTTRTVAKSVIILRNGINAGTFAMRLRSEGAAGGTVSAFTGSQCEYYTF